MTRDEYKYQRCLALLKTVLASARPNPKDHPAMFSAWCEARDFIEWAEPAAPVLPASQEPT